MAALKYLIMKFDSVETFAIAVRESLTPLVPRKYHIEVSTVRKVNREELHLSVRESIAGLDAGPSLNLKPYYEDCMCDNTDSDEFKRILADILEEFQNFRDINMLYQGVIIDAFDMRRMWDTYKSTVYCRLINYDVNEEYLKSIPHLKVGEFAVIFFIDYPLGQMKFDAISVLSNNLLEGMGVEFAEVLEYAQVNTQRDLYAIDVSPDIMGLGKNGRVVVSTPYWKFGAIHMFNKKFLSIIADRYKSDLFIAPADFDGIYVFVENQGYTHDDCAKFLAVANDIPGHDEFFLSNNVYRYDYKNNQVVLCSDNSVIC